MKQKVYFFLLLTAALSLIASGCATPRITLIGDDSVPLKEYTLQGTAKGKVLVIPVKGKISDDPKLGLLQEKPSMVQEFISQLRKAEKDAQIRAVILKIDSPGGTVTASDLLYHEITEFKKRSGKKVVAALMNTAASGGYYIALPADKIVAHPTTLTGSIGVIFLQPKVTGLMEKIGVGVDISKSGKNKDMGSWFRPTTAEEKKLMQALTDRLGQRFLTLVQQNRKLDKKTLTEIATARVYLAEEALQLKLVDQIGYLGDAIGTAKDLAKLPPDAKVVVYRRVAYPDDNIYNTRTSWQGGRRLALIDLDLPLSMRDLRTGFYYLWPSALGD
jgi:protease-4